MSNWDKEYEEMIRSIPAPKKENGFTTYYRVIRKGYLGDFTTEYWTEGQWNLHQDYVKGLKDKGEYGKPELISLTLKDNPMFDLGNIKPTSYKYDIINLGE